MIVWIASYPRSGNTLLRTILNRCFGAKSYSIYDSIESEEMSPVVGHVPLGMLRDDFLFQARASSETFFIKTHLYPPDEHEKAIYVFRDGRAALSSYRNYCRDIEKRSVPLECMVLGIYPKIHWSKHVEAWLARSSILPLRFEDLATPSRETLERISVFLGLPILRSFDLTFDSLHAIHPRFFRAGHNNGGIAEVERECPALFWRTHGELMQRLAYTASKPNFSKLRSVQEYLRALLRLETSRTPVLPYPSGLRGRCREHIWRVLANN